MNRLGLRPPSRIISVNRALLLVAGLGLTLSGPGCRDSATPPEASTPTPAPPAKAAREDVAPERVDDRRVLLFVGTSLTAALGLDLSDGYPARIQEKLDATGLAYRVVNAGVSGETSAGAVRRMDWLLRQPVTVLVLETGANDGLRGQDPKTTRANIQAIFDRAQQQDPPPKLVLVAMEALPNYGEAYRESFRAIYPELAEANDATLVPFFLEGVAGDPDLNQPDGIHPTAEGHALIAENIWLTLQPLLAEQP